LNTSSLPVVVVAVVAITKHVQVEVGEVLVDC
jgi:hypothetical protein